MKFTVLFIYFIVSLLTPIIDWLIGCVYEMCQVLMENQLEMEKMKVETGKKKISLLHDQLHEKVS